MSDLDQNHEQSLKDLVAKADYSFWEFRQNATDLEIDLASLALYRHLVHMADGIEGLLSIRAARPAIPLLRSAFETYLSLAFIHQKDYKKRSLAWIWHQYKQRIRELEVLDPSTRLGKEVDENIRQIVSDWQDNPRRAVQAEVERREIRRILNQPPLDSLNKEFEAWRKKKEECKEKRKGKRKRNDPHWYNLFGGPANLFELAKCLKLLPVYRIYYQHWSAIQHGTEWEGLLQSQPDGLEEFDQLRSSESDECDNIKLGAEIFVRESSKLMVAKFGGAVVDSRS
jgi:hypothetical protein